MNYINIFQYLDYRNFLTEFLKRGSSHPVKMTMTSLAESAGTKVPYLSKCLSNQADLNSDQAYLIGKAIDLSDEELDYFLLLVDYSRSYHQQKKSYLLKKLKDRQRFFLKTEKRIKTEVLKLDLSSQALYYMEPVNLLIHLIMGLNKKKFQEEDFAKILGVSVKSVLQSLKLLIKCNLISRKNDSYEVVVKNLHLPTDSPLFKMHQNLMRQFIHQHITRSEDKDSFNLQITFSADEEHRIKIKERFLAFLKEADELILKAPAEKLYQMQFDLFSWMN